MIPFNKYNKVFVENKYMGILEKCSIRNSIFTPDIRWINLHFTDNRIYTYCQQSYTLNEEKESNSIFLKVK